MVDDALLALVRPFDYTPPAIISTAAYAAPALDGNPRIVVIVGSSGSGKSTMLGAPTSIAWDPSRSIGSHFADPQMAASALIGAGLGSVPEWAKPYPILSTGQRFRADLARALALLAEGFDVGVDEYTSTVDRTVAVAASRALGRFVRSLPPSAGRITLATCHRDVLPHLAPDTVVDLDEGTVQHGSGRWLQQREPLHLDVVAVPSSRESRALWDRRFAAHHYMSDALNVSARGFLAVRADTGDPVGFASTISFPSGTIRSARREHRLVVLPEYQGLGIGPRLSDAVADDYLDASPENRYFAKTSHPRLGGYRDASPRWRPTSKNGVQRREVNPRTRWQIPLNRLTYSHERLRPHA